MKKQWIIAFFAALFFASCGEANHEHVFNEVVDDRLLAKEATCTEKAKYYKVCECGEKSSETFTYGNLKGHEYVDEVVNPDCEHEGYTLHTCSVCKDSYTSDKVKASDHKEAVRIENEVAATLIEGGSYDKVTYCEVCEKQISVEHLTTAKLSCVCDQQVADTKYLYKEATCTQAALYFYSCVCGEKGDQTFSYGKPLAHNEIQIKENQKDSTCTEKGSYDVVTYCTSCEKEIKRETIYLDLLEHTYDRKIIKDEYLAEEATCEHKASFYYSCTCGEKGNQTFTAGSLAAHKEVISKENETPATCTKFGLYTEVKTCEVCKKELSRKEKTTSKIAHTYDQKVETSTYLKSEATCTEAKKYFYSCTCGEKGEDSFESGKPNGHTQKHVEENRIEPTHFEDGSYDDVTYCEVCKDELDRESITIDKITHTYDQQKVDEQYLEKSADCTNAATYYYSCTCGDKGSDVFSYGDSLGHSKAHRNENVIDASLTSKGSYDDVTYCSRCSSELGRVKIEVDKLACVYDQKVVDDQHKATDASCSHKATYYYSCLCGEIGTITFESGDLLPHTEKTRKENEIFPTLTDKGSYDEVTYCDVCKAELGRVSKEIDKLTMIYDQKVATSEYLATEADCLNAATYYYSSSTGEKGYETFTYGDPLGHKERYRKENEIATTHLIAGSYDEVKYCARCQTVLNSRKVEVEKLPCSFDKQVATSEHLATAQNCTEAATYYYSCECGKHNDETFVYGEPAGHSMEVSVVKPTETTGGYTLHNCAKCEYYYIDELTAALGYTFTLNETDAEYLHITGELSPTDSGVVITFDGEVYPKDVISAVVNIEVKFANETVKAIAYYVNGIIYLEVGGFKVTCNIEDINDAKNEVIDTVNKVLVLYGQEGNVILGDFDIIEFLQDSLYDFSLDKNQKGKLVIHFNSFAEYITVDIANKTLVSDFDYGLIKAEVKKGAYKKINTSGTYITKIDLATLCNDVEEIAAYFADGKFNVGFTSELMNYKQSYQANDYVHYYIDGTIKLEYTPEKLSLSVIGSAVSTSSNEEDFYFEVYLVDDYLYVALSHYALSSSGNRPLYLKAKITNFFDLVADVENILGVDLTILKDMLAYYPGYVINNGSIDPVRAADFTKDLIISELIKDVTFDSNGFNIIVDPDQIYTGDVSDVSVTYNRVGVKSLEINNITLTEVADNPEGALCLNAAITLNEDDFTINAPSYSCIDVSALPTLAKLLISNLFTLSDGSFGIKDYYHFSGSVTVSFGLIELSPDICLAIDPETLSATIAVSMAGKKTINNGKFTTYISIDLTSQIVYMNRVQKGEMGVLSAKDWDASKYKYTYRSMTIDELSDTISSQASYILNLNSTVSSALDSALGNDNSSNKVSNDISISSTGMKKVEDRKFNGKEYKSDLIDFGGYIQGFKETVSGGARKYTVTFDNSDITSFLEDASATLNFDANGKLTTINFEAEMTVTIDVELTYAHEQQKLIYENGVGFEDLRQIWAKDGFKIVLKTGVTSGTSSDLSSIIEYVAI